jgi:hypothetical protein
MFYLILKNCILISSLVLGTKNFGLFVCFLRACVCVCVLCVCTSVCKNYVHKSTSLQDANIAVCYPCVTV